MERLKNNLYRLLNVGTWQSDLDCGLTIGVFTFLFSLLFNFISFFVSSLFMDVEYTLLPWKMQTAQCALFWFLALHTVAATIIFTVLGVRLYDNIINTPVRKIKNEMAELTRTDLPDYMVSGKLSNPFRYSEDLTWYDQVKTYVDTASAEKYIDELTGCFNKKDFLQKLTGIMHTIIIAGGRKREPKTYNSWIYGVFMVDIDHFKKVNDDFGHAAGDEVLRKVGRLLREAVGNQGVVIRNGGEEFVVVCSERWPYDFSNMAEKINNTFRNEISVRSPHDGTERKITCSVGFVSFPFVRNDDIILDIQDHVDLADMAMYLSKTTGRDRWHELKLLREPTVKIDKKLFTGDIEYGLKRGFFTIRNKDGEYNELAKLTADK